MSGSVTMLEKGRTENPGLPKVFRRPSGGLVLVLEAKGIRCKTFNDSEIIAHYLSYKIKREGRTFEEALRASLDDFDGVFSYLVATESQIGAVRDRLGIKPILFYQNDSLLLLGSEQVSFEAVDPDIYATEMAPGEVKTWSKN